MTEYESERVPEAEGVERVAYSHDALSFLFLHTFPSQAARWVGAEPDLEYDVQQATFKQPVVERRSDCVFFTPENVPAPAIFWEVYNYRNDLVIRNLLGKTGVIPEQAADRVHSALPVLFVMRESHIPNDPGFLDSPAYRLCVHERMLRENPNDPYLRLMGLTYSPPDYGKDNAAALDIIRTVRTGEGEEAAAKVAQYVVTLFLNKYRNMGRMSIMEGLGRMEGLVDPMDVPWARSFFEEGMEKGMEMAREESLAEGIAALKSMGIPQEVIDAWVERMKTSGAHKPKK